MSSTTGRYSGKVTSVGNSKGIRFDAAFFKAHPEFSGEVSATVISDGQVLLSAKSRKHARAAGGESDDPVILALLKFLEQQMASRPDLIVPADKNQLRRIGKLVEGVEVD
jgi:prlF antitoxin for toxin YhaV_toxin